MTEQQINPRIILVEDNDKLRESLIVFLDASGYSASGVSCGEELDEALAQSECEILVLDVMLPCESGFEIAKRIRTAYPRIFIVMLTSLSEEQHKIRGYASADVYLPKPVSGVELLALVNAVKRRLQAEGFKRRVVSLNMFSSQIHYDKRSIVLNLQEKALLKALVEATEWQLPSWRLMEILDALQAGEVDKSYLEMQIFRLRKKLDEIGAPHPMIKTQRGQGYCLLHEVELCQS